MNITLNTFNRYEVTGIADTGFDRNNIKVTGIRGFGNATLIARIVGWILDKIFHITVAVEAGNGTFYFNRKSVIKWLNRVDAQHKVIGNRDIESKIKKDSKCIERMIGELIILKATESASPNEKTAALHQLNEQNDIFFTAIQDLNEGVYTRLIEGDAINIAESVGKAPFAFATKMYIQAETSKKEQIWNLLKLLIANCADVNKKDSDDFSPIERAIEAEDKDLIEWLVLWGANKPKQQEGDRDLNVKFFTAVSKSNTEECLRLLDEENILENAKLLGISLIWSAINSYIRAANSKNSQNFEICNLLIEKGADVNKRDMLNELPIELAIKKKNENAIKWLVSKGADLSSTTSDGKTLEEFAREKGFTEAEITTLFKK